MNEVFPTRVGMNRGVGVSQGKGKSLDPNLTIVAIIVAVIVGLLTWLVTNRQSQTKVVDTPRLWSKLWNFIKLKPLLVITVKDMNCYIHGPIQHREGNVQTQVWDWWFNCLVEIKNKGTTATDVTAAPTLILNQGDFEFTFRGHNELRTRNLERRESFLCNLILNKERFSEEDKKFYPDGLYRLELEYSCSELPRARKVIVKGKLTKADWSKWPSFRTSLIGHNQRQAVFLTRVGVNRLMKGEF